MVLDLIYVKHFHYQMVVNLAKNAIIFGFGNSTFMHGDNRKKDLLIFAINVLQID